MRNSSSSFNRTDEIGRESSKRVDWLDSFAENMAVQEQASKKLQEQTPDPNVKKASKTAVEVARHRQQNQPSIYEMMSAIVSGKKPKYSSVEEAVKDYQERTGLAKYLQTKANKKDISHIASQIIEASDDITDESNDHDKKETEKEKKEEIKEEIEDILAEIIPLFTHHDPDDGPGGGSGGHATLFEVPVIDESDRAATEEKPSHDATVFAILAQLDEDFKKKSLADDLLSASDSSDLNDEETPQLVLDNPAIEHFINNMIDTNHGIQVPALLHSLVETFNRDGVTQSIFSDKQLLRWINKHLMNKRYIRNDTPAQIGRGVGTRVEYTGVRDPNRDPFALLVPDRSMY